MPLWSWFFIVAAIAGLAILMLLIVGAAKRRKSTEHLRERFGPEYVRTVDTIGDQQIAEAELTDREHRRADLEIHPLTDEQRSAFVADWQRAQTGFIDDPAGSLDDAGHLVARLLHACGYPVADFDQRAADVSVDHPVVVESYRQAHRTHLDQRDGTISTEAQRDAFVHYRALFEQLLGNGTHQVTETQR